MGYTILIVDDSSTMRHLVRHALMKADLGALRIVEATDGQKALRVIREERPDAVLTDLHMPLQGGGELARTILADSSIRHIPIIVVTSEPNLDVIRSLFALGVRGHITKPFVPQDIGAVVRHCLSSSEGSLSSDARLSVRPSADPGEASATSRTGERFPGVMIAHMKSLLGESLTTALETSVALSPSPMNGATATKPPDRAVLSSVGFDGPVGGFIQIMAGESFGDTIACRALRLEPGTRVTGAERRDALRELANVTCGILLRVFQDDAQGVPSMTVPRIEAVSDEAWKAAMQDPGMLVFEADGSPIAIRYLRAA